MSPAVALSPAEAHLWWLCPEAVSAPELLDGWLAILGEDERDQQRRFHFPADRQLYLAAHAAVRVCLSRYAEVPPQQWSFVRNAFGRPEIEGPVLSPPLRFNLSHTRGMVILAVAWQRDIGVDVEDTERAGQLTDLAESVFAPAELEELHALPPARWRQRFFELWTLKEAYIKARGRGLSVPLDQFALDVVDHETVRIRFDPRLIDDPLSWQLRLLKPSPSHQAAVAIRRLPSEPDLRLVEQGSPLDGW